MMKSFIVLLGAVLLTFVAHAASSVNLSISINSPPSTGIAFTPKAPFTGSGSSFSSPSPVAADVVVGTFVVAPSGWQGALALGGSNAANFSLSGMDLKTAVPINSGTSTISITAVP